MSGYPIHLSLEIVLDRISDAVVVADSDGHIILFNRRALQIFGPVAKDLAGQLVEHLLAAEAIAAYQQYIQELPVVTDDPEHVIHLNARRANGDLFPVDLSATRLEQADQSVILLIIRDTSQRKTTERALDRVNRSLHTLIEVNQLLVRAANEQSLLQRICQIMIDPGGYRLAWVGFAEAGESKKVRPVAQAGYEQSYLEAIDISWADTIYGRGPSGTAIRTGQPSVIRHILDDPTFAPWRAEALKRGYASAISLPLMANERPFGSFGIYSHEPDAFDNEEMHLLTELTNDLAYGIMALRSQAELKQRNRELTLLNSLIGAVSSSLEIHNVFTILRTLLTEQLNISGGILFDYDRADDLLTLEAYWGLPEHIARAFAMLSAGTAHNSQVVRTQAVVFKPDFREIERFRVVGLDVDRPDWQCYMGIPLLAGGEVQGVIDLFSHTPGALCAEQADFFATLGQQVGVALQNVRLFAQVRDGRLRLQTLSHQLLEAQENERRTLARELHDEIGQALTALKLNLQTVQRMGEYPASMSYIEETIAIVDHSLQQVRDLSLALRPSVLDDLGLVAALRWYVDRQARLAGFDARFTAPTAPTRLLPDIETVCFRVAQEALTNITRHAQAHTVRVTLTQNTNRLCLSIRDDGVGFDVRAAHERAAHGESLGLSGMRERVLFAGGHIDIRSAHGQGTEVRVQFPLTPGHLYGERTAQ